MKAKFVNQFTIENCISGHHVPKYYGLQQSDGKLLSCKQEPKNTSNPYMMAVSADSFTVVGYVIQ